MQQLQLLLLLLQLQLQLLKLLLPRGTSLTSESVDGRNPAPPSYSVCNQSLNAHPSAHPNFNIGSCFGGGRWCRISAHRLRSDMYTNDQY